MAGSVPVVRRLSRTAVLPVPAGSSYTVTDRRLYTLHGEDAPEVSAYTLNGRRLWHAESRFAGDVLIREAGDLLLVTGVDRTGKTGTLGIDALSGVQRWTLPAKVEVLPDGRTGLITDALFNGTAPDGAAVVQDADGNVFYPAPQSTTLRGIDLADGRTLWTGSYAGSARQAVLPGGTELVVADPAGVRVLDPRTGGVLRSTTLTGGFAIEGFAVTEDLIIAQQAGRRGGQTYAYRPDTLAEVWHTRMPGNVVVTGCRDVPCAMEMSDVRVLDPATGAVAYEVDSASVHRQDGITLLVPSAGAALRVLRDGGVTEALPGWSLIEPSDTVADRTAAPVLLTRAGDGRFWLAALARSGGVRELGSLAPAVLDCQSAITMVACRTGPAEIRLWQLEGVRP